MSLIAACAVTRPALAQDTESRALFEKGVADMEAGKLDTACPAIAESLKLSRMPGTLFTLAECYAKAGKAASAVARYGEYLDMFNKMTPDEQSKQHGRDATAREKKAQLQPDVATLSVRLPQGAPAGAEVTRDEVTLGGASLGLALPVDPGDHTIVTRVPGAEPSTLIVKIAKGEKREITVTLGGGTTTAPTTQGTAQGSAQTGSSQATSSTGTPPAKDSSSSSSTGSAQRIAGIALIGVGGAGLLVGAVTGGVALSKKSTALDHCTITSTGAFCRDQTGLDAHDSAKTLGNVSTAMFVIGGVAAVAGIVVFATAPKASAAAKASLVIGPTGATVAGTF